MTQKSSISRICLLATAASLAILVTGCASVGIGQDSGKLKKSKKPYITAKVSGRVMVDYTNAKAKRADLKYNDAEVRRAYLGIGGKIGKRASYSLSGSLSDTGDVGLVNAYVDFKPGSGWKLRAGQFKTPMSLDESTSSKYAATLERAAFTDVIEIDRRVGVGVYHTGKKHTLAAGYFGGGAETQPFASGRVASARATYAPISSKRQTIHIGASMRHRTNNEDEGRLRYRQRPYAHVANRIISSGRIGESDTFIGGEAAILHKNMWAAGELNKTNVKCRTCDSDPSFMGYYSEAGIVFGGRRTYKDGSFGRPKVDKPVDKGGRGAVALVARHDTIDLNSKDTRGGKLNTTIIGADWWPTDHWRLGVNYFNADAGLGNRGSGIGSEFSNLQDAGINNETVKGFTVRAQYDF